MLVPALLVAFAYWITWLIDGILGWQTMTRPIVLGTVIGLLCGDLKTGVIMGASLEAVYMGISGIGGSLAADYRSGTAVGVGLAILSGISMEEGIAIAVPIGALCLGLMPVTTMVSNLMEVPLMNAAKQGDVKKYNRLVWFQAIVLQHLLDTAVIFLCCYFGSTVITTTFDAIPAWLMNGLSASGRHAGGRRPGADDPGHFLEVHRTVRSGWLCSDQISGNAGALRGNPRLCLCLHGL